MDMLFGLTTGDIIYDIETFPNIFTLYAIHSETKEEWGFEISDRKNEKYELKVFLDTMRKTGNRMVGFNNLHFDYPIVHMFYRNYKIITSAIIYQEVKKIIHGDMNQRVPHQDEIVKQVDLFKIHHFDNPSKSTSLKTIEFNMRSETVEPLPYDVGLHLNDQEKDCLIEYNRYDVLQTLKFYELSRNEIEFRESLAVIYPTKDVINFSNTKIGTTYFVTKLESMKPGSCYRKVDGHNRVVQTKRDSINLKEVILPYINFKNDEFNRILRFFKSKIINETKGVFKGLTCTINGLTYVFGTGGIHASIKSTTIPYDPGYIIRDLDVSSYYPNIAIKNNFYPAHLGVNFCEIYKSVYEERQTYPKGSPKNLMLKEALNSVYGNSNQEYSPFYDPQYTMAITINGQLLLCMLAEALLSVEILQLNTDGITIRYPKHLDEWVNQVIKWWENLTKLTLESNEYKQMFIRDSNGYIAQYMDGKIKRKSAYEYEKEWNQDMSALIVPKAVEQHLINGVNIREYIENHQDIYDFMLREKVPKNFKLICGGKQLPNTLRYYVSHEGDILEKVMPPKGPMGAYKRKNGLADSFYNHILKQVGSNWDERIHTKSKTRYETRVTSLVSGWTIQPCNDMRGKTFNDLNHEYYIQEAEKLIKAVGA